jgi:hypothetical protein
MNTRSRARGSAPPTPTALSAATPPTAGWARLLRATAFGTASLLLAGLAHLLGGGRLPDLGLGLLLTAATGMVAVVVTARRCRLPLLLTVLTAEQLILHLLFAADGVRSCAATSTMPALHNNAVICGSEAAAQTLAHPLTLLMLAAHLLATALTAWLLARGEKALWRLADRVVRAALPTLASWPAAAPRELALTPLRALTAAVHRDDAPTRGPPRVCPAVG